MFHFLSQDPALSIQDGYQIYPQGKQKNIFIKWPSGNSSAICDECADEQNNMLGYVSLQHSEVNNNTKCNILYDIQYNSVVVYVLFSFIAFVIIKIARYSYFKDNL